MPLLSSHMSYLVCFRLPSCLILYAALFMIWIFVSEIRKNDQCVRELKQFKGNPCSAGLYCDTEKDMCACPPHTKENKELDICVDTGGEKHIFFFFMVFGVCLLFAKQMNYFSFL